MPYPTNVSLPQAVKDKLKGKKRRQWRHVWNSSYSRHGDESRAFAEAWSTAQKVANMSGDFNLFLPLSKVDRQKDGSVNVSGYASTPALDLDNEIVSLEAVRKALPGYWEWRNVREMHQPRAVGVGKEAHVDDRGLFLTARITDPTAAQKCIDQVYKGFSIGGKKLAKSGNTITELDIVEISVVDRPANPECRIEVAKRFRERTSGVGGYLVKAPSQRSASAKALTKMAQAVEILAKDGPPAAHDGFSLPASRGEKPITVKQDDDGGEVAKTGPCTAHGVEDCPDCKPTEKRDVSQGERQQLADRGHALPGGGFPIKNKDDLGNARQAFGRAKDKPATARLIRTRARELGVKLPKDWSNKRARKFLKAAARLDLKKTQVSAQPAFLTLSAEGGLGLAKGRPEFGHRLSPGLELGGVPASSPKPRKAASLNLEFTKKELRKMSQDQDQGQGQDRTQDDLTKALVNIFKAPSAAKATPRAKRFQMAQSNLRKTKKARKNCAASITEAHKILKAVYLAKLAKAGKKPPMDDDDDDEVGKAMRSLNKAYSQLEAMKTFVKAVGVNMAKAAGGRTGQRGQEVSDGEGDYYTPPSGIKDMSNSELSRVGPGGGQSGSAPVDNILGDVFPGKVAKRYTRDEMEAFVRAAAAEAKVEILEKMPALPAGGKRPYAFDTSKFAVGNGRDTSSIFKDVSPNSLASDDEETRKTAVGKVIGNMILQGHGRSVFDPNFHGVAGAGT